jgi:choline dehydrogenase-like flavoprotein
VIGGSSSINGLLYIRGQAEDFDRWRQLGKAGWSFADVLPYFRKAEDQQRGADEFHDTWRAAVRVRHGDAAGVRCVHRGGGAVRPQA